MAEIGPSSPKYTTEQAQIAFWVGVVMHHSGALAKMKEESWKTVVAKARELALKQPLQEFEKLFDAALAG